MADIEIYTSEFCGFCRAAKRLLDKKGVEYRAHNVDTDAGVWRQMVARCGKHTVPQIFVDGKGLGGFDDIAELDAMDELNSILGIAQP